MDGQARRDAFLDRVTKLVRRVLRERWPSVDFGVTPRKTAYWTRLDIHWSDGPTRLLVSQLAEAALAAVGDQGDAPRLEVHTRRRLTEAGVSAALHMVADEPPATWLLPNGDVSWVRFTVPEQHRLVEEFILPERPVSAHHLAALLANRIDLSFALAHRR